MGVRGDGGGDEETRKYLTNGKVGIYCEQRQPQPYYSPLNPPVGDFKDGKEEMPTPLTKDELHAAMEKTKWDLVKRIAGMMAVQGLVVVTLLVALVKMR